MKCLLDRTSCCQRARAIAAVLIAAVTSIGVAQSGGSFDLGWSSTDSGGISEGGIYRMASTIGQPDPTATILTGNAYTLTGGFLQDASYFAVPVSVSRFTLE